MTAPQPELPPLPEHPFFQSEGDKWEASEIRAIERYGRACFDAGRAEAKGEITALRAGQLLLSAELGAQDRKDKERDAIVELLKKAREEVERLKTDIANLQYGLDKTTPVLKEATKWLRELSIRWTDHENWSYARACAQRAEALYQNKQD